VSTAALVSASDQFVEEVLRRVKEVQEKADKHVKERERPKPPPLKLVGK